MTRIISGLIVFFCVVANLRAGDNFAGTWETTYGLMTLAQQGDEVKGSYRYGPGAPSTLQGKVEKNKLTFTYKERDAAGEGWFVLASDSNSFEGKWRADGDKEWQSWIGSRISVAAETGFSGLWNTSFGKMRLVRNGDAIEGSYVYAAGSTIRGTQQGKKLVFTYKEPKAVGEGEFELSDDEARFTGKWRAQGEKDWQEWNGNRVKPVPDRIWLIVVEARWEQDLNEKEYVFGEMLRAFFARSSRVEVRTRFYTDESSLRKYCAEIAYLAEPVVLVLATHACAQGITVDDKVIGAGPIAECLRYATNLRLLHFSACEALKERLADDIHEKVGSRARFPISGYTTSVDWAASAIIEFTYLEMVLLRGTSPQSAAKQLVKLLPFAGEKQVPDSVFRSTGFRLVMPPERKE